MQAMQAMKVLVTGAAGQVGAELVKRHDGRFEVEGFSRRALDIENPQDIERRLDGCAPDLLVNCAAYTAVDRAEEEPERAQRANADAVERLGQACAARGIGIVHLSTDYVFDGTKDGAYAEDDAPNPLNVYGASKLAGEESLRRATDRHLILRVGWVFGRLGRGFVDTILRLAARQNEISVVDDQIGTPTPAVSIARAVRAIAVAVAKRDDAWGTYHFSTTPALSWCAFARRIVAIGAETGLLRSLPAVRGIATSEWPAKAARPLNSRLDASRLGATFAPLAAGLGTAFARVHRAAGPLTTAIRRIRRVAMLVASVGQCVRFAGGAWPFLLLAVRMATTRNLRGLAGWMITAASYGHRANAGRYRRWLATRTPRSGPDGRVLVVVSTAGLGTAERLSTYLRLVAAAKRTAAVDLMVVADRRARAAAEQLIGRRGQVVVADEPAVDAVVAAVRKRLVDDRAGSPSRRYELVSLLAPGCVPGEMPFPTDPQAVLFYGDEDRIDGDGRRRRPFFKPAFSPDLLIHADYLSPCLTMTRPLADRLPGKHAADFASLALMLVEAADRVERIDAIVAHRYWLPPAQRQIPAYLPCYLRRQYGAGAAVEERPQGWACRFGNSGRSVSVIIPTKDRVDLLADCVSGIYETNGGGDFEVVVVDNGSVEPATAAWLLEAEQRYPGFHIVPAPGEFNWCRLNNAGMDRASGDVFVFLNNDTVPRCRGWLDRLADVASRPDVGVAGALLLYPDGTIQHAGVVVGFGGCADHIYRGVDPSGGDDMFVPPTVPRNVSAVTGACMAVSREVVRAIGPFDEGYRVTGGDVEFCLRAASAGLLNVYLSDVRLTHLESASRPRRDPEEDRDRLRAYVSANCPQDRFYSPSLSLVSLYPSYLV